MNGPHDNDETIDRLALLLSAQPREGWEDIFEDLARLEVERVLYGPDTDIKRGPQPDQDSGP